LQASGHPPKRVRLIACFPSDIPVGHMIMEYRRGLQRYVFDPDQPDHQIAVPFWVSNDPLKTATRALQSRWKTPPHRVTSVDLGRPAPLGPVSKNLIASGESVTRPRF
jgi:hypothetical protein